MSQADRREVHMRKRGVSSTWAAALCAVLGLVAIVALDLPAGAQRCRCRTCPASARQPNGCCPDQFCSTTTNRTTKRRVTAVTSTEPPPCTGGRVRNADTQGQCCWPGQAWLADQAHCTGTPDCPPTFLPTSGDDCGCPAGMRETNGHCCWPGQGWSSERNACVGSPRCPEGLEADGETCRSRGRVLGPPPACPPGMIGIPGAEYRMGDANDPDARPTHMVAVRPFCMAATEVTVGEYRRCFEAGSCPIPGPRTRSGQSNFYAGLGAHPINYVSWSDAGEYCRFAGARLPTEAEWELAARGIDGRSYPWGDDEPGNQHLRWSGSCNGCQPETTSAGSFRTGASQHGILDLAGNVAEWVADYMAPYETNAQQDPTGPNAGTVRVIRGGGWMANDARVVRATHREGADPRTRRPDLGFRCVR